MLSTHSFDDIGTDPKAVAGTDGGAHLGKTVS
jgi:hypothetical protein